MSGANPQCGDYSRKSCWFHNLQGLHRNMGGGGNSPGAGFSDPAVELRQFPSGWSSISGCNESIAVGAAIRLYPALRVEHRVEPRADLG